MLAVDQSGIGSCFLCVLPFLPVVPRRRLVSPHSARTTPRAVESSRSRRLSTAICHSSRKYLAESFLSARTRPYVRPALSPQARPRIETASDGHRIVHQREVPVRCLAKCSSLAHGLGGSSARWLGARATSRITGPVAEAPDAGVRLTARSDHQTQPGAPSPGIAKGAPGGGPSSSAIAARYYLRVCIRVLGVCTQARRRTGRAPY